jgi:hypothetical protein
MPVSKLSPFVFLILLILCLKFENSLAETKQEIANNCNLLTVDTYWENKLGRSVDEDEVEESIQAAPFDFVDDGGDTSDNDTSILPRGKSNIYG